MISWVMNLNMYRDLYPSSYYTHILLSDMNYICSIWLFTIDIFSRKKFFMEYNTVHLYNKLFFFLKSIIFTSPSACWAEPRLRPCWPLKPCGPSPGPSRRRLGLAPWRVGCRIGRLPPPRSAAAPLRRCPASWCRTPPPWTPEPGGSATVKKQIVSVWYYNH